MLQSFIALTAATALAVLVSGCSVRNADRPENKGPVDPSAPPVQQDQTITQKKLELEAFKLRDPAQVTANSLTATQLMTESVQPLSELLFDPDIFLNRELNRSDRFYWALSQFNTDIVRLQKINAAGLASSGLLDRYKAIIFLDCDINLRGTCKNLKTFGSDASFSELIQILARKPDLDVFEYYRLLKAALERPQANLDQNLSAMFLERSDDLAVEYLKLESGELPEQKRTAMRELSRLLQNIWAGFDPKSVDKARVDSLMRHFQWNISRRTDAVTAGMDKTLALAVNEYMYQDTTKEKVTSTFSEQVDAIQKGKDEVFGVGIETIYDRIKEGKSKGIFQNLGLVATEPDSTYLPADEYMYLIDRIYYGHFNTSDAQSFWAHTSRNRQRILEAASKFVRIQIANRIVWTNEQMNAFFKSEADEYDSLIPLLIAAVNNAGKMAATWDSTRDSILRVENFVASLYGNVDLDKLLDTHPYKSFHKSMSDLPHNTKMFSVYPNMMMLVYVMAKNNFNAKIRTFWGAEYTITASQVVKIFFIDVMSPWFSFGTDKNPLTKIELLYAMHFALQTETFKAFQDIPNITVTDSEFFAEITDKLTQDLRIELEDASHVLRAHFETNTKLLRDGMAACREEKRLGPIEDEQNAANGTNEILPRSYVRAFAYEGMTGMLANGFNGVSGTPLGAMAHLYSAVGLKLSPILANMRTKSDERLLYIENLYQMIDFYLEETTPASEREQVRANFRAVYEARLRGMLQYRDLLLARAHKAIDDIGDCDTVLFKHEVALKNKLYQMEEAYLSSVYNNLTELKEMAAQGRVAEADAKIVALNLAMAPTEKGLPPVYVANQGLDRYVHAGEAFYYKYYKLDSKLRMRRHLMQIAPATEVTLPNFDKVPEYANQTPTPLQPILPTADTPADQLPAALAEAKANFIDDGMRLFAANLNSAKGETPYFMLDKLTLLAQLYRLGPVSKLGAKGCQGDQCLQVTAEDIIRESIGLLKLSDTTKYDEKILVWKTSEQKHDDEYWGELAMEVGSRRQLGLLDLTLQRVFTDDMDANSKPLVNGNVTSYFQTKAVEYWTTEKSVGNYLFKPRENVTQMIKANYTGYVQDYENKVLEFITTYKKLRSDPELNITQLRKGRVEVYHVPTESVDGVSVPVYIYQDRLDKFETLVANFHESTKCAFKAGGCH